MSEDHTGNVFHQFSSRRQDAIRQTVHEALQRKPEPDTSAAENPQPDGSQDKQPYQAVFLDKSKPQSRLRLHYPDGYTVRLLNYSYLVEAVTTSHKRLSLIFTDDIVTLKGRNLTGLIDMLQDERVRALMSFHAKHHLPPEDRLMPYIEDMVQEEIKSLHKK